MPSFLRYVKCTPDGRNGAPYFTCVANELNDYPIWIIGGHRHAGVISTATTRYSSGRTSLTICCPVILAPINADFRA